MVWHGCLLIALSQLGGQLRTVANIPFSAGDLFCAGARHRRHSIHQGGKCSRRQQHLCQSCSEQSHNQAARQHGSLHFLRATIIHTQNINRRHTHSARSQSTFVMLGRSRQLLRMPRKAQHRGQHNEQRGSRQVLQRGK